jgi:hypothetical protein
MIRDDNITNSDANKSNILIPENESNEFKKLFENKNIYVEIFNNNNDRSDLLDDILHSHGANVKYIYFLIYLLFI